jgi:1D-myo-inositol 3-kinase
MPQTYLPEYLTIGHTCHDVKGNGFILGGTASYSSLAAAQLGKQTAVLTSVGDDFLFKSVFQKAGIYFLNKKADATTVFNNIYENNQRTQYVHAVAQRLTADDIPKAWLEVPIVQCSPIADEVDFAILDAFSPQTLVGATIQGWLRQWNAKGKIKPKPMAWQTLSKADVVILSDADIEGYEEALPILQSAVKIIVMTHGRFGARIFTEGGTFTLPAYPVSEVDATGAGDVFAAAFLCRYAATKNWALSTGYAHTVASFVVEGVGVEGLKDLGRVEERFEDYQKRFL